MRNTFALKLLGGNVIDAARWIGVVEEAARHWARHDVLKAPTRDRVIAAALRRAAAESLGLSALEWWREGDVHNAHLERALDLHHDHFVELFRVVFEERAMTGLPAQAEAAAA